MSGFATIARGGAGVGGQSSNAAGTTQFGEMAVAHLVPSAQAIFTHGINPALFTTGTVGAGASVTTGSNLVTVACGTATTGSAKVSLKRGLTYRAGQGSICRMTAIFGTPAANNYQLAGLGNIDSGYFFGYQGTNFGVMHMTDGYREVRKLTVSAGVATSTNVTVTLNGESKVFSISGGGTVNQTSWELSQQDYSNMAGGWTAEAYDGAVYFISQRAGPATGSYSASGTGLTATFSQVVAGVAETVSFVSQSAWNIDTMDGNGPSRFKLDPRKGNIYQIGFQYLGFGNARFAVEDSNTGQFAPVHMFKLANSRTVPVLRDPHVNAFWQSLNVGGTTSTQVQGASVALFTEGQVIRNIGPSFSAAVSSTDVDTAEKVFLTIRADRMFSNQTTHTEIFASTLTVTPITTGNHYFTARVYKNLRLTGPVNFASVNATQSFCSVDTAATGFTTNDSQLVATYVISAGNSIVVDLKGDNFYAAPGETISVTLQSSTDNKDAALAITWFEDQ